MALLGRRGHPSYRRALLFYLVAIVGPTLVLFYLGLQSVQRQRPFYVVLRRLGVDSRIELEVAKPAASGNRCRENRPESSRDRTCNQEKHGRASPKKSCVHFRALPSNAEPTFESNCPQPGGLNVGQGRSPPPTFDWRPNRRAPPPPVERCFT